jgi:hypothetical protein
LQSKLCAHPYWTELATCENTLFAFEPTKRIVPTTSTRITASITAYSAMSWARSSSNTFQRILVTVPPLVEELAHTNQEGWGQQEELDFLRERRLAFTHLRLFDFAVRASACQTILAKNRQ